MAPRTSSTHRRWLFPLVLVLAGGAIATALLVATDRSAPTSPSAAATTPRATHSAASATPTPDPTPTTKGTVAVLGDSFVAGYGADSNYVYLMAPILGVKTMPYGQVGTGFVNYGQGVPYDQRLAAILYTKPAGLVVQASVNDYETSTDAVVAAARTLVTHARMLDRKLPIAIVGPIFLQTDAQPAILAQRAGLEELCEDLDITYIDPTGWITDATKATLIGPDNLHPTTAGYERIAEQMSEELLPWASKLK